MRIGFIGLGNMGRPMAKRLVAASHEVRVFNRSAPAIQELSAAGAIPSGSAAEAAANAEVVLTALPTPESVRSVYAELSAAAVPGQLYVDHSTVDLATTRQCARLIGDRGAAFLDAPVSGGPEGAEAGTLTIMVGGTEGDFRAALPVLDLLAAKVHLCGETGAGTAMKLVNQLLVGIHILAAAESYAFAVRLGLDPSLMLEVIGSSYGASRMLARNVPRFAAHDFAGGAPMRLLAKDLDLILAEAGRLKVPLLLGSVAWAENVALLNLGRGEMDVASVVQLIEEPRN